MMEKHFDPAGARARWNREWESRGIFPPDDNSDRDPFVIILPPPNVTGVLHVGHILGDTVQDQLIRWKRMSGYNTLWIPGTDHAGIATQKVVETALAKEGKSRADMTREEFLAHAWKWKDHHHARIVEQMKQLGCAFDWTREAFTLDEPRSRAVREVFVRLYEKGLIYRGDYIVNWCPSCQTAISDEEVQYEERDSKLWWIRYPSAHGEVVVATTRPETMLGDTAVAVSPEDRGKKKLVGKTATLPIVGRELPIVADEAVDKEFGSGFVKVTPAHDPNDFAIAQRHALPAVIVIDRTGKMTREAGADFAGLDRFEARKRVVERLEQEGLLVKIEPHRHAVGTHDRCGTVIEPLLSRQWFVKMQPLAEPAVRAVENDEITFYPPRWRNVYMSWMTNIRDWCVSRQLWWGHRIPVWYCDDCTQGPGGVRRLRRCVAPPGRGRPGHVVLLLAVDVLAHGLARRERYRPQALPPDVGAGDRLGDHLLLGGAHDHGLARVHGRGSVPPCVPDRHRARRTGPQDEQVAGQLA
jgi:valyl-tRNA synthetase